MAPFHFLGLQRPDLHFNIMSETSHSPGRILVLAGGRLEAAHSLLGAITHPSSPPPLSSSVSAHAWRLDTKYYTADVLFELRHVDHSLRLENGADEAAAYEAVLLIFDADLPESFTSLQRWWEAAGGGDADFGVRLAVALAAQGASGSGSNVGSPAKMTDAEEWCAEQLVELVDVSARSAEEEGAPGPAPASPDSIGNSSWGGEATGVERIREALQAHMWPGMQLKPSPQRGAAAAPPAAQQSGEEAGMEDAVPAAAGSEHRANGAASSDGGGSMQDAGAVAGSGAAAEAADLSFADFLRLPPEAAAAAAVQGRRVAGGAAAPTAGAFGGADEAAEAEVEELQRLFGLIAGGCAQGSRVWRPSSPRCWPATLL